MTLVTVPRYDGTSYERRETKRSRRALVGREVRRDSFGDPDAGALYGMMACGRPIEVCCAADDVTALRRIGPFLMEE
jgi:hypothetical protein